MGQDVLVVREDELRARIGARRFLALPKEEIDRHYAAVEVVAIDRSQVEGDPALRRLVTFTVLHYNYSWLVYALAGDRGGPPEPRELSIGVVGECAGDAGDMLFLDDRFLAAARSQVDAELRFPGGYELRLAGLLCDDSSDASRALLGMLYVARLTQPGATGRGPGLTEIRFCGMGELPEERHRFDAWSRIVIDNLLAL